MNQAEADVEPALPGLCQLIQGETWQDEVLMKPAEQGVLPLDESPRNVSARTCKHGSAAPKICRTEPPN